MELLTRCLTASAAGLSRRYLEYAVSKLTCRSGLLEPTVPLQEYAMRLPLASESILLVAHQINVPFFTVTQK